MGESSHSQGVLSLLQGFVAASGTRNAGKFLALVTIVACIYQAWRKWYVKKVVLKRLRGKVVLITGASSGLGEGKNNNNNRSEV